MVKCSAVPQYTGETLSLIQWRAATVEKDLGVLVSSKLNTSQQCPGARRHIHVIGCILVDPFQLRILYDTMILFYERRNTL